RRRGVNSLKSEEVQAGERKRERERERERETGGWGHKRQQKRGKIGEVRDCINKKRKRVSGKTEREGERERDRERKRERKRERGRDREGEREYQGKQREK